MVDSGVLEAVAAPELLRYELDCFFEIKEKLSFAKKTN
jgi:hypothetical protein